MKSQLAKYQPVNPMTPEELLQKKKDAWHNNVALVITLEQIQTLSIIEHATLIDIGNRLYGRSN